MESLKKQLKEWSSQEVKERFESVDSQLHLLKISELKIAIKRKKTTKPITK